MDLLRSVNLIYLASPYSKYPFGLHTAFVDVCFLAGRLIEHGLKVYSPIAHTHPIALYNHMDPLDHLVWLPFDEAIMRACDLLLIAEMEGWKESYGIGEEIKVFAKADKPIMRINPATLKVTANV